MTNGPIPFALAALLIIALALIFAALLKRRRPARPPAAVSRPLTYEDALAQYGVKPRQPRQHGKRKED